MIAPIETDGDNLIIRAFWGGDADPTDPGMRVEVEMFNAGRPAPIVMRVQNDGDDNDYVAYLTEEQAFAVMKAIASQLMRVRKLKEHVDGG